MLQLEPKHIDSYQEGRDLKIICIVKSGLCRQSNRLNQLFTASYFVSGQPVPNVTWTINDSRAPLESLLGRDCPGSRAGSVMSVRMSVSPPAMVVSTLTSDCLPRLLAGVKLGCRASNNNISPPVKSNLYLKLLGERLENKTFQPLA